MLVNGPDKDRFLKAPVLVGERLHSKSKLLGYKVVKSDFVLIGLPFRSPPCVSKKIIDDIIVSDVNLNISSRIHCGQVNREIYESGREGLDGVESEVAQTKRIHETEREDAVRR